MLCGSNMSEAQSTPIRRPMTRTETTARRLSRRMYWRMYLITVLLSARFPGAIGVLWALLKRIFLFDLNIFDHLCTWFETNKIEGPLLSSKVIWSRIFVFFLKIVLSCFFFVFGFLLIIWKLTIYLAFNKNLC